MQKLKVRVLRLCFLKMINYVYVGIDMVSKKAFVVDPAWDLEAIQGCLDEEEAVLVGIFVTHSHVDHVNLVRKLSERYNVPVYMSKIEANYYQYSCENLRCFFDEDIVQIGELEVQCLLTPGHSKGSACFLVENCCFTGDTIFIEGCGLCQLPGGSAEDMFETFQRLKTLLWDEVLIYPGHRYGMEVGQPLWLVRRHNIYFGITNKEEFVKFRNRGNIKGTFSFK